MAVDANLHHIDWSGCDVPGPLEGVERFLLEPSFRGPAVHRAFDLWAVKEPVAHRPGMWVLSGFDAVAAAAAVSELPMPPAQFSPAALARFPAFTEFFARNLFLAPPADHERYRAVLTSGFTPAATAALAPLINQTVEDLFPPPGRPFDLVQQVTARLPMMVVCALLGVPSEDHDMMASHSAALLSTLRRCVPEAGADSVPSLADPAFRTVTEDVRSLLDHAPDDRLAGRMRTAVQAGRLSMNEAVELLLVLLMSGVDTAITGLTNAAAVLLNHPEVLQSVRDDPALAGPAFAEALRLFPPVPFVLRRPVIPTAIGPGRSAAAGEFVVLCLGAANRDPARYPEPSRFRLGRPRAVGMALGHGTFHCVGAAVATMQGAALVRALARHPAQPVPRHTVEWNDNLAFHNAAECWIDLVF